MDRVRAAWWQEVGIGSERPGDVPVTGGPGRKQRDQAVTVALAALREGDRYSRGLASRLA
ncbi:hypothetical protein ACFV99_32920 [Streptomyces sp. NPDC059944]|uniref:hypothetical protein n=1 Tax=unclassified Streptomyces TaxID=2593676 RepID=UPI00363F4FEB